MFWGKFIAFINLAKFYSIKFRSERWIEQTTKFGQSRALKSVEHFVWDLYRIHLTSDYIWKIQSITFSRALTLGIFKALTLADHWYLIFKRKVNFNPSSSFPSSLQFPFQFVKNLKLEKVRFSLFPLLSPSLRFFFIFIVLSFNSQQVGVREEN